MKKSILNNLKLLFMKSNKGKYKLFDSKGNPLYCIYPFHLFYLNVNYCSVCCWLSLDENINFDKKKTLSDVWNGEKINKIRNSIRNLSYSECDLKNCAQLFSSKKINCFLTLTEIKRLYPQIADYLEGRTRKFSGLPQYIMSGFDSACNLLCRSCTVKERDTTSESAGKKYIEQIEEIGADLETLLISCFGDPFASPVYREWLYNFGDEKFPKLKIIKLMTNGILWNEKNWEKVSENIKKYRVEGIISIDGATRETYEYNRGGAKFETLKNNLDFLSELRKKNEIEYFILTYVIQQNNYKEIPLIIDFAEQYSFDRVELCEIQNWGSYTDEEFSKINIFNVKHPEYKEFKKIYKKTKANTKSGIEVDFRFLL